MKLASSICLVLVSAVPVIGAVPVPPGETLYVGAQILNIPIYRYDGNAAQTFFADPAGLLTRGMTADPSGNIYVVYQASGEIVRYDPAGTPTHLVTGILSNPFGVALDNSGNLYYSDRTDNEIIQVTPGGASSLFGTAPAPGSALGYHNGRLFAISQDGSAVSFDNAGMSSFFAQLNGGLYSGIVFDSAGNLFTASSRYVEEVTPTGAPSIFHDFTGNPTLPGVHGIAIDQADNLFVSSYIENTIWTLTPDGTMTVFANQTSPSFMVLVPEPSSWALLSAGMLVLYRRRRFWFSAL
jgi:sugar lactone lactonase YvrE